MTTAQNADAAAKLAALEAKIDELRVSLNMTDKRLEALVWAINTTPGLGELAIAFDERERTP